MNPIIILLRRFGSTESKIKAIEYDNQKLLDEERYLMNQLETSEDENQRKYWLHSIQDIESIINANRLELEKEKIGRNQLDQFIQIFEITLDVQKPVYTVMHTH